MYPSHYITFSCIYLWQQRTWSVYADMQDPVVQSVINLTSLLVVKMLTVPVRTISISQVFLL